MYASTPFPFPCMTLLLIRMLDWELAARDSSAIAASRVVVPALPWLHWKKLESMVTLVRLPPEISPSV